MVRRPEDTRQQLMDEILRESREVARTVTGVGGRRPAYQRSASNAIYVAMSSTGGIGAATTGGTAGNALVTIQQLTTAGAWTDFLIPGTTTALQVRAYNLAQSAVSGSRILQLKQESVTGRLLVDFEDCST